MRIVPVESDERAVWEDLYKQYADFYHVDLATGTADAVWGWIHDSNESFWCDLVFNEADEAVGFTQYQLMHRSLGGSKVCYLSDLFVLPTQRKSGYGKALIDHVIANAKQHGIVNVRWLTQDSNTTAKSLYDQYVKQSDFVLYSVPLPG